MTTKVIINRLATGVPGLDEVLDEGLPRGYSLLVAGPSGSGKSVLAATFLAEGARRGETGVIAVFEQRPSRLQNAALAKLIDNDQVGLVDSRAPDLSIDKIVHLLLGEIQRLKATRVVIDSLSGFELALAPTFREDFRESLSRLVTALTQAGVSVLMTSELEDRYTDLRSSPYGTAFLTDAIIVQRYIEVDSRLLRVMAVVRVRANHPLGPATPPPRRRDGHPYRLNARRSGRFARRKADQKDRQGYVLTTGRCCQRSWFV